MFKPSKRLKYWYDKYNKLYFDNRLPHDALVGYNDEMNEQDEGAVVPHECDDPPHLTFVIHLNPAYPDEKISLLHEMVHCRMHPRSRIHGKRFDDEVARIFVMGAYRGLL